MKTKHLLFAIIGGFLGMNQAYSQCTPNNCVGSLPAYGGICDTNLNIATINQAYSDFESFHTVSNCFDAGLIYPANSGTFIRIDEVYNFGFSGLPAGITGTTNQASYTSPANGCVSFSGTPTEVGVFEIDVSFLTDGFVTNSSCMDLMAQNGNSLFYLLRLEVLPDPSFSVSETDYCLTDGPGTLTVDGTPGGTFSGPGVSGTSFDPAAAGAGTHEIWYVVSAQEGAAVAPATDSTSITVTVGPDVDFPAVNDLCMGDQAITLGGTPTGGTYAGPGVSGTDFNPNTAGPGTHSITYDYTDGGGCSDQKSISITVNDTASIAGTVTNETAGGDGAIDITVTGGVAPYSFDWGAAGTTEDLTNLTAGSYTVTVTTADGCTTDKTFTIDDVSSIANENNTQFKLFPNPAKNVVNFESELEGEFQLRIIDITGKEVLNKQVVLNKLTQTIDVSDLTPGNYNIVLLDSESKTMGQVSLVISK